MKKPFFYLVLVFLFFSIHSIQVCGQQTSINTNSQANFNHALKLFNSKAYAGAQKYFVEVSEDVSSLNNGDEVLVNMAKAKKSTLAGWSDDLKAKFSIDIHLVNEDEILAVYED